MAINVDGLQVVVVIGTAISLGHNVVDLACDPHAIERAALSAFAQALGPSEDSLARRLPRSIVSTFMPIAPLLI